MSKLNLLMCIVLSCCINVSFAHAHRGIKIASMKNQSKVNFNKRDAFVKQFWQ